MKKLFVLFLLVALVPFTVGCGLFGSDYDDPDPVTYSTLKLSKVVPAGWLAGNIRAAAVALNYSDLQMVIIDGTDEYVLGYEDHYNTEAGVVVVFNKSITTGLFNALKGKAGVQFKIILKPAGFSEGIVFVAPAPIDLSGVVAGTAPANPSAVALAFADEAAIAAALSEIVAGTTVDSYKVLTVKNGTTDVSTNSAAPTALTAASAYTFVVAFNKAYTNAAEPTFEVEVRNTRTGTTAKAITSTTTNSPVAVTWNNADDEATIVVTPNSTYELTTGETYSIVLTETNAVAGTLKPVMPKANFITIVQ